MFPIDERCLLPNSFASLPSFSSFLQSKKGLLLICLPGSLASPWRCSCAPSLPPPPSPPPPSRSGLPMFRRLRAARRSLQQFLLPMWRLLPVSTLRPIDTASEPPALSGTAVLAVAQPTHSLLMVVEGGSIVAMTGLVAEATVPVAHLLRREAAVC